MKAVVVTDEQVAIVIVEVQAVAFAVVPRLAAGTLTFTCPTAVTHNLETVLPYIPEVIAVDVALIHVAAHRGATTYGAVAAYRGHLYPTAAIEEMVAHTLLILTEITLAGIADIY